MKRTRKKRRTNPIWFIPKEELQNDLNTLNCYADIIEKYGYPKHSAYYRVLKQKIEEDCLDISLFLINQKIHIESNILNCRKQKYTNKEVFVENSTYGRQHLKNRIIKENLIEYKCDECGNAGEYNKKPLSLHLDHINGVNNDNRLENLRLLCPNCHSQTETYSGKNRKKEKNLCECGKEMCKNSKLCLDCSRKIKYDRRFDPTKEELEDLLKQHRYMTDVAKIYQVSDNAVRKRCRLLGIDFKTLLNAVDS